jgi:DNA replication protein DnaC
MTMSMTELERSLRALRLSGMTATLENRALQVAQQQMDFIEAFSALVQDELDRRRSRLIDRRFVLSGLPERKDLKDFDWQFNPKLPKRQILELAALKFIDEREDALFIGSPGVGKSHAAKALALLAVQRGYTVIYREAHVMIDDIHQARELGELKKYRATLKAADLVVIDDLFLRKIVYAHYLEQRDRGLGKTARRCGHRRAAPRPAHASREPAQVHGQELAAQRIRRTPCQGASNRVIIHASRHC